MSSVMPFTFNEVELKVVTINDKPWTRAKEICRALEYNKATKTADIVRHLCSQENYAQKYDLTKWAAADPPVNCWANCWTHKNTIFTSMKKGCMKSC